jgi:hypothetical protein
VAALAVVALLPALMWRAAPGPGPQATLSVALAPGLLRDAGAGVARVNLPRGCDVVHLDLVTGADAYTTYSATVHEVSGEPKRFYHCHCSRCRKATGTGHASNLFLQPGTLRWLSGEEQVRAFKVPEAKRFTNTFCAACGGRLPRQAAGTDIVLIPAGFNPASSGPAGEGRPRPEPPATAERGPPVSCIA